MKKWILLLLIVAVVASLIFFKIETGHKIIADVIYYNGNIITLDAKGSTANAVAVKDGNFLAVGNLEAMKKFTARSTKKIDLNGKTVVPGLIDAHCHPMEAMMMKETWVDCRYPETPSVKVALQHIASWAKKTPKGKWIFAAAVSASENKFAEKRLPTKAELDIAAPDNPTMLSNGTHMGVANSAALKTLGITKGMTKLPHGGSVILDKNGEPTGVLTDAQADVPFAPTAAELKKYYTKDIQELWNSYGYTSLMAITPLFTLPALQEIAGMKIQPTIRYTTSVWTSSNGKDMPEDLSKFRMPEGTDPSWYRFGGIKLWVDGENDCRTGYMYEPYVGTFDTDPPGNKGTLVTPEPDAKHFTEIATKNGVISMMHCSGDAATDIGLTAYEQQVNSGATPPIMRIEHFGMFQMTDKQLARAVALKSHGLRITIQPTWLLDLVNADYENMGPERTQTGFKFRSMIDAGLEPAAGSDVTGIYLDNVNPFLGIYAAVTRNSDKGFFEPQEAVTPLEALKMWTIWAAKSMGESNVKGSIEPGKYADMTVLSDNILTMPKENLKNVKTLKTIVGGRIVYEAK
ncbi:MAG: amidohydrolase family protein [Gammaproteobacteria bacterium]|nr:amidohydrolase family protein [Gammaproteobacteria bacterium]